MATKSELRGEMVVDLVTISSSRLFERCEDLQVQFREADNIMLLVDVLFSPLISLPADGGYEFSPTSPFTAVCSISPSFAFFFYNFRTDCRPPFNLRGVALSQCQALGQMRFVAMSVFVLSHSFCILSVSPLLASFVPDSNGCCSFPVRATADTRPYRVVDLE